MKIISLSNGEQNAGIYPHSSTHHAGGTDEISAEAIGAETVGTALAQIDAHRIEENPHPNMATATPFTEEFDDFLSMNAINKLGWSSSTVHGWAASEPGNRFPGSMGVFALGIGGTNTGYNDFTHLRLGSFPIIPQPTEGYLNLEISSVVGLSQHTQTNLSWRSCFGLLDSGSGNGINSSMLISAEFFDGGYNWVATWRSSSSTWAQKQIICPVSGNLNIETFNLKIRVDCELYQIIFSVDNASLTVTIGQADWTFGAMSPIFYISKLALDSPGRVFYVDKYLFRKNVSD